MMFNTCTRRLAFSFTSMLLGSASLRAEETFKINLSPPTHVGEKFAYYAEEMERSHIYHEVNGENRLLSSETSALNFHAAANVEACDQRGAPSRVKFTVKSMRSGNWEGDFIKADTEVTARPALVQDQPPRYSDLFALNDEPCHPAQSAALHRVVTIGSPTESTEQEAFGTDKPIPIGGAWTLDGEPGARLFAKIKIDVNPKDVTGTARLIGIVKHNKIDCLEIRMAVNCSDYKAPTAPGKTANKATAVCDLVYYIAKDTGRVVESQYQSRIDTQVPTKFGANTYIEHHAVDVTRDIQIDDVPK